MNLIIIFKILIIVYDSINNTTITLVCKYNIDVEGQKT